MCVRERSNVLVLYYDQSAMVIGQKKTRLGVINGTEARALPATSGFQAMVIGDNVRGKGRGARDVPGIPSTIQR